MINHIDIRVFVIERDAYAQQAIVTYLGWDRRTRVIGESTSVEHISPPPAHERIHASEPDVVTLDTDLAHDVRHLAACIGTIRQLFSGAMVACLAHEIKDDYVDAAANAGARAYFLREDIGRAIASALCDIAGNSFILSHGLAEFASRSSNPLIHAATIMAPARLHPALSQRVEQALELCVMGGMPAEIAADEMGVSTSTIRSYIKEGYRILEAEGDEGYPIYMSPAERAFLRLSALDDNDAHPQSDD
jgi:DNA-binding NarL/FixJ family response regulator